MYKRKPAVNERYRQLDDGRLDVNHFWNFLCADKMWRMHNLYWVKNKDGKKVRKTIMVTSLIFPA